jgi:hypothetical protein
MHFTSTVTTLAMVCAITVPSSAQDDKVQHLESRILALEKKVNQLEQRLEQALSPAKYPAAQAQAPQTSAKRSPAGFAQSPLLVQVMKKSLKMADVGETEDKIALLLSFKNTGTQNITSFKGEIVFKDIYADSILSFIADIEKSIAANMSNSWFGGITYDSRNPSHRRLLDLNLDRVKVEFIPEKIVFADGTTKNY